jgi:hypothetical protein
VTMHELIATCQPVTMQTRQAVTMQTPSTPAWRGGERRPGVAQNEYAAWRVTMDAAPPRIERIGVLGRREPAVPSCARGGTTSRLHTTVVSMRRESVF